MFAVLAALLKNEAGVTAIEYAVLSGVILIAIIAVVGSIGTTVSGMFSTVSAGF